MKKEYFTKDVRLSVCVSHMCVSVRGLVLLCVFVYVSICLCVYVTINASVERSIMLFAYVSTFLCFYVSIMPTGLCFYVSIMSTYVSIYVSIHLPLCIFVSVYLFMPRCVYV